MSISEALVRMNTHEQNECHALFFRNNSVKSKSIHTCECDVALGWYCIFDTHSK